MSRIGKKIILVPANTSVEINGQVVRVKGPKGELSLTLHSVASATMETTEAGENQIVVTVADGKQDSAVWGTMRALLQNMVTGVTEGWSKSLELNGVGFKMEVAGKNVKMRLGYSHEVIYTLPEGIIATIEGNVLTISGSDREIVGKVASEIRSLKKPEPYKGKGFRYTDETIIRKAGKAAKGE